MSRGLQRLILVVVIVLSVGLVVAATIGAGVGGAIVSISFLAMVVMGVLSPGSLPRTGREHETRRRENIRVPRGDEPID